MTGGYAKSVRHHAPQAIICIDPYHVVQLANQALDEVRRVYWNELRSLGEKDTAKRFKEGLRKIYADAAENLNLVVTR